jgi:hypothetical protein
MMTRLSQEKLKIKKLPPFSLCCHSTQSELATFLPIEGSGRGERQRCAGLSLQNDGVLPLAAG